MSVKEKEPPAQSEIIHLPPGMYHYAMKSRRVLVYVSQIQIPLWMREQGRFRIEEVFRDYCWPPCRSGYSRSLRKFRWIDDTTLEIRIYDHYTGRGLQRFHSTTRKSHKTLARFRPRRGER